jgi:23S rRNA-/tRNA-specific pseudouridylate synthase
VLILARTKHLARELSRQFRTHTIAKTYLALVRGEPRAWNGAGAASGAKTTGLITAPISLDDDGRVQVHPYQQPEVATADLSEPVQSHCDVGRVGGSGKAARTAWEVLASSVSFFGRVSCSRHSFIINRKRLIMRYARCVVSNSDRTVTSHRCRW